MPTSPESVLSSVETTSVDTAELAAFTNERQHFRVAFGLFRETAACVCVLSSTTVGASPKWNVGQAVLGGHLVRMFKLMRLAMEESAEDHDEMLSVLLRLLAECVINLRFLIQNNSSDLIQSYLSISLQHEKELANLIRGNIAARGDVSLSIEDRMLKSISRSFENSLLSESDLPNKRIRNWGDKNLFEKAQNVGLGEAYIAAFGGPSRNVHGGWQDLLQYHLECDVPGEFRPRLEFKRPRPQPIHALTHLISGTLTNYIEFLGHPDLEPVCIRVADIDQRNRTASDAHEQYLARKSEEAARRD